MPPSAAVVLALLALAIAQAGRTFDACENRTDAAMPIAFAFKSVCLVRVRDDVGAGRRAIEAALAIGVDQFMPPDGFIVALDRAQASVAAALPTTIGVQVVPEASIADSVRSAGAAAATTTLIVELVHDRERSREVLPAVAATGVTRLDLVVRSLQERLARASIATIGTPAAVTPDRLRLDVAGADVERAARAIAQECEVVHVEREMRPDLHAAAAAAADQPP